MKPSARSWTSLFVWAVWLLASAGMVGYVVRFGSPIPIWDDLPGIDVLIGTSPFDLNWLWYPSNEHHVPLPKLLLHALHEASGWDVRSSLVFDAVLLSLAAAGLILALHRSRGAAHWCDALIPLAFLHWGHSESVLWSWTLTFILPVGLAAVLLALVIRCGPQLTLGQGLAAGGVLVLMSLCGPPGFVYVVPLTVWLGWMAVRRWNSGEPGGERDAVLFLFFPAVAMTASVWGLLDKPEQTSHPDAGSLLASLRAALQFLGLSFGWLAPARLSWMLLGPLAVLLAVGSGLWALVAAARHPEARPRALGLFFFGGGLAGLALGLGWGRGGYGEGATLEPRYVVLAAPLVCWVYAVWALYPLPRFATASRVALFGLVFLLACLGSWQGAAYGRRHAATFEEFERHLLEERWPRHQLVAKYGNYFTTRSNATTELFQRLHDAEFWPFQHMWPDPPFQHTRLELKPIEVHELKWNPRTNTATVPANDSAYLIFPLPEARLVNGVRLRYKHVQEEGLMPNFQMFWRRKDRQKFPPPSYFDIADIDTQRFWCPALSPEAGGAADDPDVRTLTVWICEVLDEIRIHPDTRPCRFQILSITLLTTDRARSPNDTGPP